MGGKVNLKIQLNPKFLELKVVLKLFTLVQDMEQIKKFITKLKFFKYKFLLEL